MHLHFAGMVTYHPERLYPEIDKRLDSYAYTDESKRYMAHAPAGARMIIDSGAFTAHSTGRTFRPEEYAEWGLDFKRRSQGKLSSLHFMNLDVIGDQEASWRNQAVIERVGLEVMPIITYGCSLEDMERAVAEYEYLAIGGVAGGGHSREALTYWLDRCFSVVAAYRKRTGVLRKVHLLGITRQWLLERYPAYSCDSASWVGLLRFGTTRSFGSDRVARVPKASEQPDLNLYALRQEIRKYKQMEADVTRHWAARGVKWPD